MNLHRSAKSLVLAALSISISVVGACADSATNVLARVALLSDPHVNRSTNGDASVYKAHFEKAIAQVNAAKVDLVLIAGDLTQSGKPPECADFKNHIKNLSAPVCFVPGNHDVGHKFNSGQTNGTITVERVTDWEKIMGPSWFAKEHAGLRVIGVNSSLLGSGFEKEAEMWKFLEHELAEPARIPTVLFMHYPLFQKKADESGGVYFNTEPTPRARLLTLLKKSGVKTVLTGHLHHGLTLRHEGMLLLTTPPISFGLPRGKQPEGWTLVTILKNGDVQDAFQPLE